MKKNDFLSFTCPRCLGYGFKDKWHKEDKDIPCDFCKGTGSVNIFRQIDWKYWFYFRTEFLAKWYLSHECPYCEGSCFDPEEDTPTGWCPYCHGSGFVGLLKYIWYYFSLACNNE